MSINDDIRSKLSGAVGVTNAINTTTLPEDFFAQGKSFTLSQVYIFGADSTSDFLFDPTGYTPPEGGENRIVAFVPEVNADAGPILITFYADSTAEGGALQPAFNRDGTSPNLPQLCVYKDTTVGDEGTSFSEILVPATTGGPVNVGAQSPATNLFAIDTTKKIIMRVHNQNGAGTQVGVRATWFEI
jgi:hypothetical protein